MLNNSVHREIVILIYFKAVVLQKMIKKRQI